MGKLTNWLEGFLLTGLDRLSSFPFIAADEPNFTTKPHKACRECPQVNKEGHTSYECGKMLAPVPTAAAPRLWAFATLQYLIHTLSGHVFPPYGATSGFMYYGYSSVNFADQYNYKVTAVGGDGNRFVTITTDTDFNGGIYLEMRGNWGAPGRTFLSHYGLAPQPNDRVYPGGGSLASGKVVGRVVRVIMNRHAVPKSAVVECDQDMSGVLVDNREDQTDPWVPNITFIRQAGQMESYTPVVWPSEMQCQPRLITIPVAGNEEWESGGEYEDGRIFLKRFDGSDGRAADPETDPEKTQTFKVWKKQKDPVPTEEVPEPEPSPVEDITGVCVGRFKRYSYGGTYGGADQRGAYKTVLCLGEKNWDDSVDFTPLYDEDTEWIKILYYPEVIDGHTGTNHCVPCGRRCAHAIRDMSNSFYDMDDGEAHLANGEEYYCAVRRTEEVREVYTGPMAGRWEMVFHKPAKSEMFTADCSLYGVCPMYTPIHKAGIGTRPFTLDGGDANQILKELVSGQDIALVQVYPGYPLYYVRRIARPTIHSLTTAVPTNNPTEWSPNITFVQAGPSYVGNFDTKTEEDSESSDYGTTLNPLIGGAWDGRTPFHELSFPNMPPPGIFPTNIAGWVTSKIDAFRRAFTDAIDVYKSQRYYEDDQAVRCGRVVEDAQGWGRGVSQAVRTIGADERFLLEALDLRDDAAGEEQDRLETTFKWFATPQVGPFGFAYRFMITFKNLLPEGGSPRGLIKESKIMKVTAAGGKVVLHLENQSRSWARLKNVGIGNSFNEVFQFICGGGNVRPPDPLQIRSSETDGNSFGGVQDWISIGDSAVIDHEATGFADFNKMHWGVTNATAYNGDKAADFGPGQAQIVSDKGLSNGYYQIPEDHFLLPNGQAGRAVGAEITTIEDYDDTVTTFTFDTTPPFRYYQWLKVEGSTEIIQVLSVDYTNKQISVWRGYGGTTAAAIPTGKKLTLIRVWDDAAKVEVEVKTGDTKPTLATNECWYDEGFGRFYWSEADAGKYFAVAYYVEDGTENINPTKCYMEQFHQVFVLYVDSQEFSGVAFFLTELSLTRFIGTGHQY